MEFTPDLRIVLKDYATENVTDETRVVWHPGDSLEGYLQVSSTVTAAVARINVFFEGTTRAWILIDDADIFGIKVATVEHKFLQQVQHLYDEANRDQIGDDQFLRRFDFKFIIPPRLLPRARIFTDQLLHLPPSLKAGESHNDQHGQTCMQPLINYAIRAVLEIHDPVAGSLREVQDTRNILLVPFIAPSPPLATEDFPGEYILESTKLLTKIPYRNPFGEISISMNEPSALVFTGDSPNATTLGNMKLILKPANRAEKSTVPGPLPGPLKCTIHSQIHVIRFYSTMPFYEVPTYSMLKRKNGLRVESQYIDLQTRKMSAYLWRLEEQPRTGGNQELRDWLWTTTLALPVCGPSRLLPTFCSTLAALRYALSVRVNIKGFYHSPIVLEIPMQVLCCRGVRNVQEAVSPQLTADFDPFQHSDHDPSPPAYS